MEEAAKQLALLPFWTAVRRRAGYGRARLFFFAPLRPRAADL